MSRQLGGAFGIGLMNTYAARRMAVHRSDLVSNLQGNNILLQERLHRISNTLTDRGVNRLQAKSQAVYATLDHAINNQAQMRAYLDGFLLISIFFIAVVPFILMLKTKPMDAATRARIASEAH